MQRLSHDERDNNDSVSRDVRKRSSADKVADELGSNSERQRMRAQQSRTVEVSSGKNFYTMARLDESGEFDNSLQEWTVFFLEKNQPSFCPIQAFNGLQIKIGSHYGVDFVRESSKINVRIHNVESQGEKSLTITVGNELMLLGRITGCPEERSPDNDEDTVFEGDIKSLVRMLKSEQMFGPGVSFKVGCLIFQDFLLNSLEEISEEGKSNWETFE